MKSLNIDNKIPYFLDTQCTPPIQGPMISSWYSETCSCAPVFRNHLCPKKWLYHTFQHTTQFFLVQAWLFKTDFTVIQEFVVESTALLCSTSYVQAIVQCRNYVP
jgi:hypothetical protein